MTPTTADLPPDGRTHGAHHVHDWAAHAARLRAHHDEWTLLETDFGAGMIDYLRTGKQPDLAALLPELELRIRASVLTPTGTRRGELWGRYTPGQTPARRRGLSDEQVRDLRIRYAAGGVSTTQLATELGMSQSAVNMMITGARRAKAGGPLTRTRTTTDAVKGTTP